MKYDTFISYHRDFNFPTAQLLKDRLEAKGLRCYLDIHEAKPGVFNDELVDAIKNSPNLILVVSDQTIKELSDPKDWVRKEIEIAHELGKNIVPVFFHSFRWPRKWDKDIPEFIQNISNNTGVPLFPNYIDKGIDDIFYLLKDKEPKLEDIQISNQRNYEFYISNTQNLDEIKEIEMAFHAGNKWFSDPYNSLLENWLVQGKKVKVIINSPSGAEILAKHMRRKLMKLPSFIECIQSWQEMKDAFPELLEVKISDIPIKQVYHSIKYEDSNLNVMKLTYYIYKNTIINNCISVLVTKSSDYYKLYQKEYDYLWNQALDIDQYVAQNRNLFEDK